MPDVPPTPLPPAGAPENQKRPEAVVFDFGGVLITSISNQVGAIAASHGVDTVTMIEVLLGPPDSGPDHPWHRAERGEIAVSAIQALLEPWAGEAGIRLRGDEMDRMLAPGGYSVVTAMVDRVGRLRSQGYRTGLLTNTFAEFRPTMERDIDFRLFDMVVESFAVGSRKPERAIYEEARDRLGVDHETIVFLDDFEQNLTEPIALGWTTIRVGDHAEALVRLDEVLAGA